MTRLILRISHCDDVRGHTALKSSTCALGANRIDMEGPMDPMTDEIIPGVCDLVMKDGRTQRVRVGITEGVGPWWVPLRKEHLRTGANDDWHEIASMTLVSRESEAPLDRRQMDAIHGPPDPTDGTDGDIGSDSRSPSGRCFQLGKAGVWRGADNESSPAWTSSPGGSY